MNEEDIEIHYNVEDGSYEEFDFQDWPDEDYMEVVRQSHDGMQEPLKYHQKRSKHSVD